MTLQEMQDIAITIADAYKVKNKKEGHESWDISAYMAGFVGDVGDLSKLIMANENYRHIDEYKNKLSHELSDCMWSILIIAHILDIDIEKSYEENMEKLRERISKS